MDESQVHCAKSQKQKSTDCMTFCKQQNHRLVVMTWGWGKGTNYPRAWRNFFFGGGWQIFCILVVVMVIWLYIFVKKYIELYTQTGWMLLYANYVNNPQIKNKKFPHQHRCENSLINISKMKAGMYDKYTMILGMKSWANCWKSM